MASIRDYATTIYAAATTANMVMDMPVHVSGDLLLAFVGKDGASAFTTPSTSVGTPVSSSNWTLVQSSTSTGAGGGIYALRAASASENVTFPLTIDTCVGTIISIKDVNGTTVADAVPNSTAYGAEDSTLPFGGVGITTTQANALLFSHRFADTTTGTSHLPPWVNIFSGDAANGGSCVAYSFEPTVSTAVTAPEMWAGGTDDGKAGMVEVRDGSSGASIPPYIPLDVVPSVLISPLVGVTGAIDRGAYAAVGANVITSVAGKTVSGVALAVSADSGYNPFRGSARSVGVSSTIALSAMEINMTATQDVTTGDLIFGTYLHLTPRDYLDTGTVARGGKYFLAGSTSANWRAWVVGGQFSKTDDPNSRVNWLVQPSYSTSQYGFAGTPDFASLDIMQFGSSGYYGLPAVLWNELWELRTAVVAGGSSTTPFAFDDLIFAVNNGCGNIPVLNQSGSAVSVWIPLQIGGNDKIGIGINLRTFQWPKQADTTSGYVDFHVANDKLGIEFYGLNSSDYIHFTNCVFTSDSSYYWRFNASHSVDADIDFGGSTVIGANVTLRSTVTLDNVSFISCGTFTQNSATLTNCAFSNTKVTSASPADAALITSSTFTSSGTGYAIEIGGTVADITLTNVDFSGYAATDGTSGNEAVFINTSAGSMILTISGGTTPSIRVAADVNVTVVTSSRTIKVVVTKVGGVVTGANVYLAASGGATGPFPSDATAAVTSITRSGATATVSHTAHGMATNDQVNITGITNANKLADNAVHTITWLSANSYSFSTDPSGDTTYTGTIKSTFVFLKGEATAGTGSNEISMSRAIPSSQPVTGWARKSTSAPYYKEGAISGTVSSTGDTTFSPVLISDD